MSQKIDKRLIKKVIDMYGTSMLIDCIADSVLSCVRIFGLTEAEKQSVIDSITNELSEKIKGN